MVVSSELDKPKPHGCFVALLLFTIIANAGVGAFYLIGAARKEAPLTDSVELGLAVVILALVCNVVFAVALLRWKRWGVYGFVAATLVDIGAHLWLGDMVTEVLWSLVFIGLLLWTLQMGGADRAWVHLD